MPRKKQSPKKEITVVHLGNVATPESDFPLRRYRDSGRYGSHAEKTKKYAKRFPNVRFIGIDLGPISSSRKNWKQILGDWEVELEKLKDNSINIISSEFGLAFPGRAEGTLNSIFRKLRKGGKLMFVCNRENIKPADLIGAGFKRENITIRPLKLQEIERTPFMQFEQEHGRIGKLVQVIAMK